MESAPKSENPSAKSNTPENKPPTVNASDKPSTPSRMTSFGSGIRKRQELVNNLATQLNVIIISCCDNAIINKLENRGVRRGDGITAWRELCALYTVSSPRMQLSAFIALIGIRQEKELRAPDQYIHEFRRLCDLLQSTGLKLPETILKYIAMNGLSDHFATITEVMEHSPELTLDQCVQRVLSYAEDHPQPDRSPHSSQPQSDHAPMGFNAATKTIRKLFCYNCGSDKHTEMKCGEPCRLCTWDGKPTRAQGHTRFSCPEKHQLVSAQKKAGIKLHEVFTVKPRQSFAGAANDADHEQTDWGLGAQLIIDSPKTPKTPQTPVTPPMSPLPVLVDILTPDSPLFGKARSNKKSGKSRRRHDSTSKLSSGRRVQKRFKLTHH